MVCIWSHTYQFAVGSGVATLPTIAGNGLVRTKSYEAPPSRDWSRVAVTNVLVTSVEYAAKIHRGSNSEVESAGGSRSNALACACAGNGTKPLPLTPGAGRKPT